MIKAILFDFDGVLTIDKTGSTTITNYISQKTGIPLDLVKSSYHKYNRELLYGEITHRDMWSEFCDGLGQKIDYHILIDSFESTALDKKMLEFIKELKKNYLIGMVTDNKCDRIDAILSRNELENYFDVVAISAEQHSGKDDIHIFQYAIDKLDVNPSECVFIDNTAKNLIIPNQMGMKTILFDDEQREFDIFKENIMDILLEDKAADSWKLIGELTDKTVLGSEGLSAKAPRKTSRAILRNSSGLYAVMYAREFNLHSLPGGGIEEGESEVDTLIREVFEETGCTCDSIAPLGIVLENRYHADYTVLSYYFVVNTKTEDSNPHLTEAELKNGTCLKWCTLEEAIHLIKDIEHNTNQRRFLQARDVVALTEYAKQFGI